MRRLFEHLPEAVRYLILVTAAVLAIAAALSPVVFLLRRMGVG